MTLRVFSALLQLILILTVCGMSFARSDDLEHARCDIALKTWAGQALEELAQVSKEEAQELKELLFFLHVPRTGGRTYHQCLLRHLYDPDQLCDRSYDRLRFNSSQHCKLLVTHDDYSVLTKLPRGTTSVVTNMRHPVDRVFSAYEFSVEVASRFLARPQQMKSQRFRPKTVTGGPSTLNIWPWKFLVPWMREDLFRRRTARNLENLATPLGAVDHYNASQFVMPLHEFIHQPIVMELLHNGATFQVAGLTNNSYTKEAGDLRKCVIDYPDLGHHVLNVAKRRIDKMLYVGLTEKHKDTATVFAHVVGGQVLSKEQSLNQSSESAVEMDLIKPVVSSVHSPHEEEGLEKIPVLSSTNGQSQPKTVLHKSVQDTKKDPSKQKIISSPRKNLTVNGLIKTYENCAGNLRESQVKRRIVSLKNLAPVNFSNEARRQVAEGTLDAILRLNSLDLELHGYAQLQFSKEQVLSRKRSRSVGRRQKRDYSQLMVDERTYQWYSAWSGSRKVMVLMILSMAAGVTTVGVGLFVFVTKGRGLKFQTGLNHGSHEKI